MSKHGLSFEKSKSIYRRYSSLQEGRKKRNEVVQDEVFTKHLGHMSRLWESGDPKIKVAVEVKGCQVNVLYVQNRGETESLYNYIMYNLMSLPIEDERRIAVEKFNLHLWSHASAELRKRRAKGKH